MKKFLVTFLMIIVCFILQSSVFSYFNFGGVVPNLLVILAVSTGIMHGEKDGLLTGFVCGLLMDIFFGDYIGLYALLYMYLGFMAGYFNKVFYPDNILLPLATIISSDLVYGFSIYILTFLIRTRFHFGFYLMHVIIPEVVYTTIVALFMYPCILAINMKLDEIIQRSAKKFV